MAESLALPAADIFLLGVVEAAVPRSLAILFLTPARILASPAALILPLRDRDGFVPLIFAHLALAAAAILARPAALIFLPGALFEAAWPREPKTRLSFFCSDEILSWILAACLSCFAVRSVMEFMVKASLDKRRNKSSVGGKLRPTNGTMVHPAPPFSFQANIREVTLAAFGSQGNPFHRGLAHSGAGITGRFLPADGLVGVLRPSQLPRKGRGL